MVSGNGTILSIDWCDLELQWLVVDLLCKKGIIPPEVAEKAKQLLAARNRRNGKGEQHADF